MSNTDRLAGWLTDSRWCPLLRVCLACGWATLFSRDRFPHRVLFWCFQRNRCKFSSILCIATSDCDFRSRRWRKPGSSSHIYCTTSSSSPVGSRYRRVRTRRAQDTVLGKSDPQTRTRSCRIVEERNGLLCMGWLPVERTRTTHLIATECCFTVTLLKCARNDSGKSWPSLSISSHGLPWSKMVLRWRCSPGSSPLILRHTFGC